MRWYPRTSVRRREADIEIGTEQHFRWLHGIVLATVVINGIDAVLTLVWVLSGRATEANPLMETLLRLGPLPFVVGKLALVSGGTWLLWTNRRHPLAVIGLFLFFLAYYWVLLHHLRAMNVGLLRAFAPVSGP